MSAASNYYSGSYDYDNGGNIYVHLHVKNIGRAMGGIPITPTEVASIFQDRKKQALDASKKQFKTLFFNSLNEDSKKLLNQVFNNDNLMTDLQNELGKKVEDALAVDKMIQLMEIERSGIATDNFAKTILSNSQDSIKNFNILLNSLEEACKLLGTESGSSFAAILSHSTNVKNTKDMGSFLLQAIDQFKKANNKKLMSELQIQQGQQIIESINALGRALKTGRTSGGDTLGRSAIRRMIESIFNTGFAESISAIIKQTTFVSLDKNFKAALTGATTAQIQYSDEFGNIIGKSKGKAAYGKADASFNNVKIKLNGNGSIGENIDIVLDIGISDKFYKTNYFPGLKGNKNQQSYSAGAGGSLTEALWSSFGSNLKYLYYAYNTLGHGNRKGWDQAQGALNEVILTRQIIRLFAARGGNQDFAQFMFVNGQIIPIWSIIMSTMENISLSSSLGGQKIQPVTLSIKGRDDIQKTAQNYRKTLEERIYNVNKAVQKAKITAHVNLNNLNI